MVPLWCRRRSCMPGTTQSVEPRVIVIPRQLEAFFYERLKAQFAERPDVRVVVGVAAKKSSDL